MSAVAPVSAISTVPPLISNETCVLNKSDDDFMLENGVETSIKAVTNSINSFRLSNDNEKSSDENTGNNDMTTNNLSVNDDAKLTNENTFISAVIEPNNVNGDKTATISSDVSNHELVFASVSAVNDSRTTSPLTQSRKSSTNGIINNSPNENEMDANVQRTQELIKKQMNEIEKEISRRIQNKNVKKVNFDAKFYWI